MQFVLAEGAVDNTCVCPSLWSRSAFMAFLLVSKGLHNWEGITVLSLVSCLDALSQLHCLLIRVPQDFCFASFFPACVNGAGAWERRKDQKSLLSNFFPCFGDCVMACGLLCSSLFYSWGLAFSFCYDADDTPSPLRLQRYLTLTVFELLVALSPSLSHSMCSWCKCVWMQKFRISQFLLVRFPLDHCQRPS